MHALLTSEKELIRHVFSYLDPKTLEHTELVSKFYEQMSKENGWWRNAIQKYFPYLMATQKDAVTKNAREIFIREYNSLKQKAHEEQWEAGIPLLLASLSGELDKIESERLEEGVKGKLYVLSAVNGHLKALDKLGGNNKQVLLYAVAKKRQFIVETLLKHKDTLVADKEVVLKYVAMSGRLSIVETLLNHTDISVTAKENALVYAAENGHFRVVEDLLHIKDVS